MKITFKNSGFENIGTVISVPEGSALDLQSDGSTYTNVGKVLEERSIFADLRASYPFLASTGNEEIVSFARELSKVAPDRRQATVEQSPLWERWLQNGGNAASITAAVAQLVSMFIA